MQVSAHKDAVSLFERYSKPGDSAKLKDWAGKTLPTLKHHLEMAQIFGQEQVDHRNSQVNRSDQGIVRDEKGQKQPADKKRARTAHRSDPKKGGLARGDDPRSQTD